MEYEHDQTSPRWVVVAASNFAIVMCSLITGVLRSDMPRPVA